jgi:hypothetical protein
MIETIKILSEEENENIVSAYLNLAKSKVLRQAFPYKNVEILPERLHAITIEITVYMLNKRGAEGESRHSENGIDRTYENADIPSSLLRQIIPSAEVI